MDPLTLGLIAAAPQVIKGVSGLFQSAKGKALARRNPFPVEGLNQNYLQNVAEAEQAAREGLPSQQYNNQLQNIEQNQAGGVRLLSRSANPVAGVSSLVRAGNQATGLLNAQDAAARMQNRRYAAQQRGILAGEQARLFNVNQRQRYLQNAQAAAEYMRSGRQNTFGALDNLSAIGMSALGGGIGGGNTSTTSTSPNFGGIGLNTAGTPSLNPNYNPNQYNLIGGQPQNPNFNFGALPYNSSFKYRGV